jgi:hypothetical protein
LPQIILELGRENVLWWHKLRLVVLRHLLVEQATKSGIGIESSSIRSV